MAKNKENEQKFEDGVKSSKKIWKKWWFWLIVVIIIGGIIPNNSDDTKEPEKKQTEIADTKEQETEAVNNVEIQNISDDEFVEKIKSVIQGQVGEDEKITDVQYIDNDLYIYVDIINADPSPLTFEDLATIRTTSITDRILELNEYDSMWNHIVVDFGEIGYISNGKENISSNEFGRYFSESNFKIEQTTEVQVPEETELIENSEETESVEHREGMYGISDKNIDDADSHFTVSKAMNDVTGNWKISCIAEAIDIEEYALSYYNKYFADDKEVHIIVNFTYNTSTTLTCLGNILDVSIHEYVEKEEHDAKKMGSGMLLKEYYIYLDNGDIEEI